jgi:hypothetical protein
MDDANAFAFAFTENKAHAGFKVFRLELKLESHSSTVTRFENLGIG